MRQTTGRRAGPREWTGLAVLALPTVLLGLDVTVLHLALPSLAVDLRPTSSQELWIVDAYGLLIAGFLITMGTVGDRVGRRRLLMVGGAAFIAASVAAAHATSAEALIAARAALGVAGATLMPSTLALISDMFADARQRALAIGWWATSFALGMAAGPLVGGALVELLWWGAAFLVAVPVVGVMLVAAPFLLPEHRAVRTERVDPASVALSLGAMLPIVYGIKEWAKDGPGATALAALAAGLVLAVLFVRRQRVLSAPLLDVGLFRNRAVSVALVMMLVGLVGVGGIMLLVTQYLQLVQGIAPLTAGLLYGPPALMMVLASVTAPLAARRVRPGYVVAAVLALSSAGYVLIALVGAEDGVLPVVVGFSLVYLGLGAIAALGTELVVGSAPPEKAGSASAVSETVQELGVAVGIAVIGSLAGAVYRARMREEPIDGVSAEAAGAVGDSLSGAVSVASEVPAELLDRAREAFTAGMNAAGAVGAVGILALSAVTAVALRHVDATGGSDSAGREEAHVAERPR